MAKFGNVEIVLNGDFKFKVDECFETTKICDCAAVVAAGGISSVPGCTGRTNAMLETSPYCVAVMTRARWPCAPSLRLEYTDFAFARSSLRIL